jgi:hypothetical protein
MQFQGRIHDFVLGGTKVGEGSVDRLRSPAGSGQSPGRAPVTKPPEAPGFWIFRKLFRQQFWSILWMWWSVLKRMNLLQKVSKCLSSECKLKGDVTWNYLSGAVTPLISLSCRVFVYSEQVRTLWTRCKLVILNVFIGQFWIFGHYRQWSMTAMEHGIACSAVGSVQKFKIDQWKRSK